MTDERLEDVLSGTVAAFSATGDDALSKALAEGLPDRDEVVAWAERAKTLVLRQRDRSSLRSELPALAGRLEKLLRSLPAFSTGEEARRITARFLARLPAVRSQLAEDVEAALDGDPAARSFGEIVAAYPSIEAVATYRIAHELHVLGVPLLPRIVTEQAHARTGIDIHPGARIGRRFFIDHGTGVVIGETCEIGDNVKLYQGVTLGARSFARDEGGAMVRGRKRHPTLEDDVTIYAGATILGGETVIGRGSVIGGNVWLTHSVEPCTLVQIAEPRQVVRRGAACAEPEKRQLRWDL